MSGSIQADKFVTYHCGVTFEHLWETDKTLCSLADEELVCLCKMDDWPTQCGMTHEQKLLKVGWVPPRPFYRLLSSSSSFLTLSKVNLII